MDHSEDIVGNPDPEAAMCEVSLNDIADEQYSSGAPLQVQNQASFYRCELEWSYSLHCSLEVRNRILFGDQRKRWRCTDLQERAAFHPSYDSSIWYELRLQMLETSRKRRPLQCNYVNSKTIKEWRWMACWKWRDQHNCLSYYRDELYCVIKSTSRKNSQGLYKLNKLSGTFIGRHCVVPRGCQWKSAWTTRILYLVYIASGRGTNMPQTAGDDTVTHVM